MANEKYIELQRALGAAELDLDLPADIRVVLVMSDTTFNSDFTIVTMGAVATPDYYDGVNHDSVNGHALTNLVWTVDPVNRLVKFSADPLTIVSMGVGTRQAVALIMFKWVTNISSSVPLLWIDTGGYPFDGDGGNALFTWNVKGIFDLR